MNKLGGKVILKESGRGISDLLVAVYDVDARAVAARPTGRRLLGGGNDATAPPALQVPAGSVRLGSVLTDREGRFQLSFEDADFRKRQQNEMNRPDILLAVSAPEEGEPNNAGPFLYMTAAPRQSAGRAEEFLVRLTAEQLKKADIPLPSTPSQAVEAPERIVGRMKEAQTRDFAIADGLRAVSKQHVDRQRATIEKFRANVRPALSKALSHIPDTHLDRTSLVSPGESVLEKMTTVIRRSITKVINGEGADARSPVKGVAALTDEQKTVLAERLGPDGRIAGHELEKILKPRTPGNGAARVLMRNGPLEQLCRERSINETECASALGVGGGTNSAGAGANGSSPVAAGITTDMPGSGVDAIATQDMNRFVARLMDTMTSPEESVVGGLEPRADQAIVARKEGEAYAISFPPSPADTASIFDFHNLQIAFEHVWQEAIDEGILNLAEDAYREIVELGGDPAAMTVTGVSAMRQLIEEGRLVGGLSQRGGGTFRFSLRDAVGAAASALGGLVDDYIIDPLTGGASGAAPSSGGILDWLGIDLDPGGSNVPSTPGSRPGTVIHVPSTPGLPWLLAALEKRLKEDYAFTIYAANRKERSINFGVLVSYRQKWEPEAYQAGKLAKTVTLAPKETQRFTKKTTVHRKRSEKEVENQLRTRRDELATTSRAELEIVRKATTKTNFHLNTQHSTVPIEGVGDGSMVTTDFTREAATASDDVKKAYHEAVIKSAHEYKDEHNTEVNTEETSDTSIEESGEITNPNDEIAVTFLFYELQRRYRVTEHLHRVTPVILVAQEVPRPDQIDEAWLVTHDWILKRVLLDDSFAPALTYLSQNVVGDQAALNELKSNIQQQRKIVAELKHELTVVRTRVATHRNLLEKSLLQSAAKKKGSDSGGLFSSIPVVGSAIELTEDAFQAVGDLLNPDAPNVGDSPQDTFKEILQRTVDEERELLLRLEREVTALNSITETYTKKLAEHLNHRTQTARLRTHIKQNILFYMQAIWSHEPPDQRFFRLHKVPVPNLAAHEQTYMFRNLTTPSRSLASRPHRGLDGNGTTPVHYYQFEVNIKIKPEFSYLTLAEVADLDTPLGFKGNYMIFRLKKSNALTDHMMHPYVVAGFDEVADPDGPGNWTLDEFAKYVCCLKATLSEADFGKLKPDLLAQYQDLLKNPHRNGEVIVVPTGSLFIEALPGRHSLMEEFKARHRAIDVKKVQAEVRMAELENLRRSARILAGEREDPNVEKTIVVNRDPTITIDAGRG